MTVWLPAHTYRPYASATTARFAARVVRDLLGRGYSGLFVTALECPPWAAGRVGPAQIGGLPCVARLPLLGACNKCDWTNLHHLGTRPAEAP